MSIHSRYAEAILTGAKRVEFRKRRLAPDITTVLMYATMPVGKVVGAFEVTGYDIASPSALWGRHQRHGGIVRADFRAYYRGTGRGVGILLSDARRFDHPVVLADFDEALRPPQSFRYVSLQPWVACGVSPESALDRIRSELSRPSGPR